MSLLNTDYQQPNGFIKSYRFIRYQLEEVLVLGSLLIIFIAKVIKFIINTIKDIKNV